MDSVHKFSIFRIKISKFSIFCLFMQNVNFHMTRFFYILILVCGVNMTYGADFFVATNGNNNASGTISSPLSSVSEAISRMSSGDSCFIRTGRYHEEIVLNSRNDLSFFAYNDETVVFDGTKEINLSWEPHAGNIYKSNVDETFWQLFANEEMQIPARWPNARLDDLSVWDQENNWAKVVYDTSKTDFTDQPTTHSDLSALGFSVSNAIAVMNVGSFKSYARKILTHSSNSSDFSVNAVGNRKAANYQYYFLEGKLELLDSENEWFLDQDNLILYAWGDLSSTWRGKVQDYAFSFTNCNDITISGIDFFATTVSFKNCDRARVEHGKFDYPSCTKRMLGEENAPPPMTTFDGGGNHIFYNNEMRYADTPAVYMTSGLNNKIENCLFEYIDWSSADLPSLMMTVYMRGTGSIFNRNSAHTTGASAFLDVNSAVLATSNAVWNTGLVQNDGSIVQLTIGAQPNSETAYNWFYDTEKYGARFDASTALGSPTGSNGLMHHNVGFNLNATIMQKGDYHQCINNTSFDTVNNGIIILSDNVSTNTGTVIRNNAAERIGSHRKNNVALTSVMDHSHNWNGYEYSSADIRTVLRDPDNLDLRPKPHSTLIDNGKIEGIITQGYIGSAPDIGAYEAGASSYWIPGRQEEQASHPIPPNNSNNVKSSAALMWRKALSSTSSKVYLGTSSNQVAVADESSNLFKGEFDNNIFDPLGLSAGTYFWRVDEQTESGIVQGNVWTFEIPSSDEKPGSLQEINVSNVSLNSAQINYSLSGDISSDLLVKWWKANGVTNTTQLFSVSGTGSYVMGNLSEETTYFYNISSSNSFGSSLTNISSFETTTNDNPVVDNSAVIFSDDFESTPIGSIPNDEKWNSIITLNGGEIIVDYDDDHVLRLNNPSSNPDGARTTISTVGVFNESSLITVSFDSYFDSNVIPSGSFFLGAGNGSLASHQNQIRKVSMREVGMLDTWHHFDWIVNQTGASISYPANGNIKNLPSGSFDLWRDGALVISNSTEKTSSSQDIPLDDTTLISSIGFTANKNDMIDWRINNLKVRDEAYIINQLSPYEIWASNYGIIDEDNDLDNDGINNLFEYGIGTEPLDSLDGPQRLPKLSKNGEELSFIYYKRNDSELHGLGYFIESTSNLINNDWQTHGFEQENIEIVNSEIVRVTNNVEILDNQKFYRMRINLN